MKRVVKPLIAIVLTGIWCLNPALLPIHAQADDSKPNVALLESILNDRDYVIQTLLMDNYSTNPHARINGIYSGGGMMGAYLDNYKNSDNQVYYQAVQLMNYKNNADIPGKIAAYVAEFGASLASLAGLSDVAGMLGSLTASAGQLQYESILKEAFSADYTGSSGVSVSGYESQLGNIRRLANGLKGLKEYAGLVKAMVNNDAALSGGLEIKNLKDYVEKYLEPYLDALNDYIDGLDGLFAPGQAEGVKLMTDAAAAIYSYEAYHSDMDFMSGIVGYMPGCFLSDETLELVNSGSGAFSLSYDIADTYMFLEGLRLQKDTLVGPLSRMRAQTPGYYPDLRGALQNYIDLSQIRADDGVKAYKTLESYLRSKGTVKNLLDKHVISKQLESLNSKLQTTYTGYMLTSTFSSMLNVLNIALWCADKAVNFETTCKKTYELECLNTMLNMAKSACYTDWTAYLQSRTDGNAKKVLDDLLLLQKLRLRGEKICYTIASGQINSWMGRIITGGGEGDTAAYYAGLYQRHIDVLLGASPVPFATQSLTVPYGETLLVGHNAEYGGLYGILQKQDGTSVSMAELSYRVMNGLTVNSGAKLRLIGAGGTGCLPYVVNKGAFDYGAPGIGLLELKQESGETGFTQSGTYSVRSLNVSGGVFSSNASTAACESLATSGTVALGGLQIRTEDASLSGTLSGGTVYAARNVTGSGATLPELVLNGSGAQTVAGTLYPARLVFSNPSPPGVTLQGTLYVSQSVRNEATRVQYGQNTILREGGGIDGAYYHSALTLQGTSLSSSKTFGNNVYTQGAVAAAGMRVKGVLYQKSGSLSLNGDVTAEDDVYLTDTVSQGGHRFTVMKSITANSKVSLGSARFEGGGAQSASGAFTVRDFVNANTSPPGLTVNGTITVTGTAASAKKPLKGENISLAPTAVFAEPVYYGDVTVKGLAGPLPAVLNGTLFVQGSFTQSAESTVNGKLVLSSGTVSLGGSGALNLKSYSIINGTLSGEGTVRLYGDLQNNGDISVKNLVIDAFMPRSIAGRDITVTNLTLIGGREITLSNIINVLGFYAENGVKINTANIRLSPGAGAGGDAVYREDLTLAGDWVIDGHSVKVGKNVTVTNGGIVLKNGGRLEVGGMLTVTGGGVSLSGGSDLQVGGKAQLTGSGTQALAIDAASRARFRKLTFIKSMDIAADGTLTFEGDAVLTGAGITGLGTVELMGDLSAADQTRLRAGVFRFAGRMPQRVTGAGLWFHNLTVANQTAGGVSFSSEAFYSGVLETGDAVVAGKLTYRE